MDQQAEFESFYYIKSALRLIKRYWYLFVTSSSIAVVIAFFINWYSTPVYEVSSVILIDEHSNTKTDPSQEFMKDFSIFTPISDIQREILKMKSSELVYKALQETNSEISYYESKGFLANELYNNAPFIVKENKKHVQPLGIKFIVKTLNDSQFQLTTESEENYLPLYDYNKNKVDGTTPVFSLNKVFKFGDSIVSKNYSFIILKNEGELVQNNEGFVYHFNFNHLTNLTYEYQKALKVEQISKDLQAANIKIRVRNGQKGIEFINALTQAYLQRNIDKKNRVAENTIQYLENQLNIIEDSLKLAEYDLQTFRSANKIMQINAKADEVFKGAHELENQKAELEQRAKYYNYISEKLETNKDGADLLVPSSMGVNDMILANVIQEYIKLNAERNDLIKSKQTHSPYFASLNIKIDNARTTLSDNIKFLISTNTLLLSNIEARLGKENAQISDLPNTERQLVGKERKYRLNDNIYTFMLEKKAEAQVAKASNLSDNDILEPAKLTQPRPVSPNKMLNLILAISVGLFLPFVGFGIKSFFNDKIEDANSIKPITHFPSVGEICHNKNRNIVNALADAPQTILAETFRNLRANTEFLLGNKRNQLILITSCKAGEGKSFNACNLAISMAMLNRKTIIIDFDLRRPSLHKLFGIENKTGISEYLSGNKTLEESICEVNIPNLHFIPAGNLPINPAELINSVKTAQLIEILKKNYDYIVLDTPPIGIVSEAYILMQYANLKVLVIRRDYTPRKNLVAVIKQLESKQAENVCYLLNDVDIRDTSYWKNKDYFPRA